MHIDDEHLALGCFVHSGHRVRVGLVDFSGAQVAAAPSLVGVHGAPRHLQPSNLGGCLPHGLHLVTSLDLDLAEVWFSSPFSSHTQSCTVRSILTFFKHPLPQQSPLSLLFL